MTVKKRKTAKLTTTIVAPVGRLSRKDNTSPRTNESTEVSIEQMTTMEIKCGIYVSVWVNFLNFSLRIAFKSNAKITGRGKPTKI